MRRRRREVTPRSARRGARARPLSSRLARFRRTETRANAIVDDEIDEIPVVGAPSMALTGATSRHRDDDDDDDDEDEDARDDGARRTGGHVARRER
jgi:hypothetical protein